MASVGFQHDMIVNIWNWKVAMIILQICLQAVIFSEIFLEITDVQVVHWHPFFYVHDRFQITLFFLNRVVQR